MKIIFVTPWYPYPAVNGTKVRLYNLIRALAERHEVRLLSFVRAGEQVDQPAMREVCQEVELMPWREFSPQRAKARLGYYSLQPRSIVDTEQPEIRQRIADMFRQVQPEMGIFSQWATARYAPQDGRFPLLLEEAEVGSYLQARRGGRRAITRLKNWLTWYKAQRYFRQVLKGFQGCSVVSQVEMEHMRRLAAGGPKLALLPNGVDIAFNQPNGKPPIPGQLIYPGALTYAANYDAMRFFLEQIFPQVCESIPEARLIITGSTQGVNLEGLKLTERVVLSGFLPDIREAVGSSWACAVPLRAGGGTRLKILEAMALGTPVISTSKGAEGLDVTADENILIADGADEFARKTIHLLQNGELRDRLSRRGRQFVEQNHSWSEIGRSFRMFVESMIPDGSMQGRNGDA